MSGDWITREELIDLFGESMPIEAAHILCNVQYGKTADDVRAELRQLAGRAPEVQCLYEETMPDLGVVRLEKWPEGYVLWFHGEIRWKSWV